MHVVELNEIESLTTYRDDWAHLLDETPNACFFQTLDWLAIYWRHFGEEQRLRVLLVYDADRLVGILPLVVKTIATRGGAVRTLGYPLDGWGTRYSAIGANSTAVLSAGLGHVYKTIRDWDVLELDWTAGSHVAAATAAFAVHRVCPQAFARSDLSLVNVTGSWDDYWTSRHGKHRNNVRRAEKKLAKFGTVEVLHYNLSDCHRFDNARTSQRDTPDARWDLYETCEQVAARSWQGTSATGTTLTHERVRQFLREVHDAATRLRAVSIHLLSVASEPVAFSYNYVFQGTEYGLRMGYNSRFKSAHPGTVLIHRVLQNAFAGDRLLFDLGEGDSGYKHIWRTDATPSFRFCHYAKTSLRAQALRWKRHWCGEVVKSVEGRSL